MIPDELSAFLAGISFMGAAWSMREKQLGLAIVNMVAFGLNVLGSLV